MESHDAPPYPHLGLAYLAAYIRNEGIDCTIIDAKLDRIGINEVEERLRSLKPDLLGITAMTHDIFQAHRVAQAAKGISSNIITVIGGCHATALPGQTLEEFPSFDVIVFGEGEYTFLEFVKSLQRTKNLHGIKGLGYRASNGIYLNEPRELIRNLDELPFPAWDLFTEATIYPVLATRGCPFGCNFCMRLLGRKLRKRTPQNIIGELREDMKLRKVRSIHFFDEVFAADKKMTHELLDAMIEEGFYKKIKWTAQTNVNFADYEVFKKMKVAGCDWLAFGVESGNEQIVKATKKGITLAQAAKAVELAKRAGLKTGSYFIFGHPFESRKTAEDTIDFARRLNTTTFAFGIMVPYPGTEVYEMARKGEGGYRLISPHWADFNKTIGSALELQELSRKDLERLELLAYLKVYLFNYRLLDLVKLFWNARRIIFALIRRILGRRAVDRSNIGLLTLLILTT